MRAARGFTELLHQPYSIVMLEAAQEATATHLLRRLDSGGRRYLSRASRGPRSEDSRADEMAGGAKAERVFCGSEWFAKVGQVAFWRCCMISERRREARSRPPRKEGRGSKVVNIEMEAADCDRTCEAFVAFTCWQLRISVSQELETSPHQ